MNDYWIHSPKSILHMHKLNNDGRCLNRECTYSPSDWGIEQYDYEELL